MTELTIKTKTEWIEFDSIAKDNTILIRSADKYQATAINITKDHALAIINHLKEQFNL